MPIFPRSFLRLFKWYRRLERENARLQEQVDTFSAWSTPYPPGHFYSPLPSSGEIARAFERGGMTPNFPGIEINESEQLDRLERFRAFYNDVPFPEEPTPGKRFFLNNHSYTHFDAIMLYCMLRELRPKRVIEVGSGHSSAAMLDINEQGLAGKMDITFIDPEMSRLRALLRPEDLNRSRLIEQCVQDVPLATFAALRENDVLFIDSSHVSKIGSDVNWIYFHILPVLAPGVMIHIHDVSGVLEYPRDWIEQGRAWNEQYLLRAFLMHNRAYRIELFTSWMLNKHRAWFTLHMPACVKHGGGQLWLRKVG